LQGYRLQRYRRALICGAGVVVLAAAGFGRAGAQAVPTATAGLQLSAFGGATGTFTGVGLGKNLAITAGVDATFRPFFTLFPSVEVRGTYPVDRGSVDGQKNVLAGLKLARHLGRLEPYGDILVGRGEIDFSPPYPNAADTELFQQTASTVISPGAGCDVFLTDHLGFKGDFQFQRYQSPVTTTGNVFAKAFTVGVVYRIPLGGLGRGRSWR
jgi:hypothetical protein